MSVLFLPHFDVLYLLNRHKATWNLLVLDIKETKNVTEHHLHINVCPPIGFKYEPIKMKEYTNCLIV